MPDVFTTEEDDMGNGTGGGETDVLFPDDDDDTPPTNPILVDPDTVLVPDDGDDTPSGFGGPVVGPILPPILPDSDFQTDDNSTFLQHFLGEEPGATTGIAHLDTQTTETLDPVLGGEHGHNASDDVSIAESDKHSGDGGNDVISDGVDVLSGSAGDDAFWLYHDTETGLGQAQITGFVVGQDFLRISLNPDTTNGTPSISVQPSDDGLDGIVAINGEIVAILQGTPGASTADIYVDTPQNIFR